MKFIRKDGPYIKDCSILKESIGGSKNIETINRCSTRIRITLKDISKVNQTALQTTTIFQNYLIKENTVQLIIKHDVENIFIAFLKSLRISYSSLPNTFEVNLLGSGKKSFFKWLTDGIAIIMNPIIPLLITLAIVSTLANVFNGIDFGGGTLASTSEVAQTIGNMLKVLQSGVNLAFTILIPWSIFKVMKGSQAIGITIGVVLCCKDLMLTDQIMGLEDPIFKWDASFGSIIGAYPWKISYEGQILPIVLMSFVAVYIERFANKKMNYPVVKEMIAIPMITILTFFIAMLVVGPIGLMLTYGMNLGIVWATTNSVAKYIFNPAFGLLLPWMVVTGFIQIFVVINMQQFTNFGGTTIMPMFTQLNIAVATSLLALMFINRSNKELRKTGIPSSALAYISGSTEPALFGITLRFMFPVIAASIGATVGILITTFSGVVCTLGNASLLVFLSVTSDPATLDRLNVQTISGGPYLWMAVAIGVTFVVTFVSTIGLSKLKVFKQMNDKVLERDFSVN
ncbi:PTS transporter subunit EIIB [Mesoplasma seiffertii]|uniref:PTS transporter subunit EIIB n=1 Tax=Mesoplasma seiffertii TaxID=28224 RepID=UPI00047C8CDB|nr:PTS transporter subunit EIIB [Mesoplasma seiffertii]